MCAYLPDWEHADILKRGVSKAKRKILESSLIEAFPCTNSKAGDVKLAKSVAIVLVEEHLGRNATWTFINLKSVSCAFSAQFSFRFCNLLTDEVLNETGLYK